MMRRRRRRRKEGGREKEEARGVSGWKNCYSVLIYARSRMYLIPDSTQLYI